jgi:hypothetical protein
MRGSRALRSPERYRDPFRQVVAGDSGFYFDFAALDSSARAPARIPVSE